MASQQVITALDSLHRELEKLEPAIKHVETAQLVTQIVKEIPQKHIELLKEIKDDDSKFKGELKDIFTKDLSSIADENRKLEKTTAEIQKQVKSEQDSLATLKNKVQAFHDKIELIQFPERLDKVDANVAGIMAAVQSIQSRIDTVERNISDRLKEMRSEIKDGQAAINNTLKQSFSEISNGQNESQKAIQGNINSTAKTQRMLIYLSWGLFMLVCAVAVYLKLR